MTRIKDPKQVANTIRHILLILISSLRVCFMTGRRGCCSLRVCGEGEAPVRWKLRGSGGTDEDCLPVNELNASNTERTTAGLLEGGWEEDRDGVAAPPLGGGDGRAQMCDSIQELHSKNLLLKLFHSEKTAGMTEQPSMSYSLKSCPIFSCWKNAVNC